MIAPGHAGIPALYLEHEEDCAEEKVEPKTWAAAFATNTAQRRRPV
jgi:hypothetical protein